MFAYRNISVEMGLDIYSRFVYLEGLKSGNLARMVGTIIFSQSAVCWRRLGDELAPRYNAEWRIIPKTTYFEVVADCACSRFERTWERTFRNLETERKLVRSSG